LFRVIRIMLLGNVIEALYLVPYKFRDSTFELSKTPTCKTSVRHQLLLKKGFVLNCQVYRGGWNLYFYIAL
jgi:hypothetical protein